MIFNVLNCVFFYFIVFIYLFLYFFYIVIQYIKHVFFNLSFSTSIFNV